MYGLLSTQLYCSMTVWIQLVLYRYQLTKYFQADKIDWILISEQAALVIVPGKSIVVIHYSFTRNSIVKYQFIVAVLLKLQLTAL